MYNSSRTKTMINKSVIVFAIAGLLGSACSGGEQTDTGPETAVKTVNVTTQTIMPSSFASYVRVVGTVETSNDIMISAEVSGRVISYNVNEGDLVQKGQPIMKIDDSKLKQEKARLEAITAQAKENYDRLRKVYEEDGIGSELDVLNARYTYEQSLSSLESIKVDLENTSIKAPFTGRVEDKMIEEGEMVAPGTPVVRLIGMDNYIISAGVPARYANVVKQGDKVDIWFDHMPGDTLQGTIRFAGKSINPQNRTFDIEVDLPGNNDDYKVDMIANLRLKTNQQENVIVLSEEFVYSKNAKYVVYVVGENEEGNPVAEEREVQLGLSYRSNVIIEDGLEVGDELITLGSAFLDDGMRVTVKETANTRLAAN